ncbi:hypothetical protein VP01_1625g5 [Puccinia sorghi]|uniref:Uncharacterized protein n=1 Tax=Puccinia sorghi TaxID=27349 RepID=A0A0L6VGW3_9BASI|nr:hypothetical protein VP01_1625g5 [Puccinia sorghi]
MISFLIAKTQWFQLSFFIVISYFVYLISTFIYLSLSHYTLGLFIVMFSKTSLSHLRLLMQYAILKGGKQITDPKYRCHGDHYKIRASILMWGFNGERVSIRLNQFTPENLSFHAKALGWFLRYLGLSLTDWLNWLESVTGVLEMFCPLICNWRQILIGFSKHSIVNVILCCSKTNQQFAVAIQSLVMHLEFISDVLFARPEKLHSLIGIVTCFQHDWHEAAFGIYHLTAFGIYHLTAFLLMEKNEKAHSPLQGSRTKKHRKSPHPLTGKKDKKSNSPLQGRRRENTTAPQMMVMCKDYSHIEMKLLLLLSCLPLFSDLACIIDCISPVFLQSENKEFEKIMNYEKQTETKQNQDEIFPYKDHNFWTRSFCKRKKKNLS